MTGRVAPDIDLIALEHVSKTLSTIPVARLPQAIGQLSNALLQCKDLLSTESGVTSRDPAKVASLNHKIRSKLTSLLQDRTVSGRWSAVALIKTYVELGGYQALQAAGSWINGLIVILKRPQDPASTKKLCMITLTRIFSLTRAHQALQRELTTPRLPDYISACLGHFDVSTVPVALHKNTLNHSALVCMLRSLLNLLPHHPTVFRSFTERLRRLAMAIFTFDANDHDESIRALPITEEARQVSYRLFVKLHHTAPKSGSGPEWENGLGQLVSAIKATSSRALRAFVEISQLAVSDGTSSMAGDEPTGPENKAMGLSKWSGVEAGVYRLTSLLHLLKAYLGSSNSFSTGTKIGPVIDITCRILSTVTPRQNSALHRRTEEIFNPQISKQERELVQLLLPGVHVAALQIFTALIQRTNASALLIADHLLDQLVYTYDSMQSHIDVRAASYTVLHDIIEVLGLSLDEKTLAEVESLLVACCNDLMATLPKEPTTTTANKQSGGIQALNPDAMITATAARSRAPTTTHSQWRLAAEGLLATALAKLAPTALSSSCRTRMDRTAILMGNSAALTASVLNPAQGKMSLLPITAKICHDAPAIEALAYPRMPVIQYNARQSDEAEVVEDMDLDGDEIADVVQITSEPILANQAVLMNTPQTPADQQAVARFGRPEAQPTLSGVETIRIEASTSTSQQQAQPLFITGSYLPANSQPAASTTEAAGTWTSKRPQPATEVEASMPSLKRTRIPVPDIVTSSKVEAMAADLPIPANNAFTQDMMNEDEEEDFDEDNIPPLVFKTDSEDSGSDDEDNEAEQE